MSDENTIEQWTSVADCAAALGVTPKTARQWCREAGIETIGGGGPGSVTRIPKVKFLLHCCKRAAAPSDLDEREKLLKIAYRQAKLDEITKRLETEALDAARLQSTRTWSEVRLSLTGKLPAILADALSGDRDRLEFEAQAKALIVNHLAGLRATMEKRPDTTIIKEPEN